MEAGDRVDDSTHSFLKPFDQPRTQTYDQGKRCYDDENRDLLGVHPVIDGIRLPGGKPDERQNPAATGSDFEYHRGKSKEAT